MKDKETLKTRYPQGERIFAKTIYQIASEMDEEYTPYTMEELFSILSELVAVGKLSIYDLYLHILKIKRLDALNEPDIDAANLFRCKAASPEEAYEIAKRLSLYREDK